MKRRFFLILTLLVFNVSRGQTDIYNKMKDSVDRTWVHEAHVLETTEASYFTKINIKSLFISPIKVSGYGVPFSWDSDLSILKFLSSKSSDITIFTGKEANKNYLGTKIMWTKETHALLFLNEEIKKSTITSWYLFGASECPKMHLFPSLEFEELYYTPNPVKNDSKGIALYPYPRDIREIKEKEIRLKTLNGKSLWGFAYDLNGDEIQDIFIHYDSEYDTNGARQQTLYVNVEGNWLPRWNNLEETRCF